jgi:hypothetical protein
MQMLPLGRGWLLSKLAEAVAAIDPSISKSAYPPLPSLVVPDATAGNGGVRVEHPQLPLCRLKCLLGVGAGFFLSREGGCSPAGGSHVLRLQNHCGGAGDERGRQVRFNLAVAVAAGVDISRGIISGRGMPPGKLRVRDWRRRRRGSVLLR